MDKDLMRDALETIAILADDERMPGIDEARAMGRAIYLNLGTNIEEHFFEGMVEEARRRGSLDDLISAFVKAAGSPLVAEKSSKNDDNSESPYPPGKHRIPGTSTFWRSATRKTYGGAPLRRGERVLIWPKGRKEKGQADEPVVAICVGLDADEEPILRTIEVMSHHDDFHFADASFVFVDTIDELRPGTWTRLSW